MGPIFILTHSAPRDEADPTYSFVSGDVREAVASALAAAGGCNLLVLGANAVGQCLREGLIDEILILLLSVLLGEGVRLFGEPGTSGSLEMLDVSRAGWVVNLRCRAGRVAGG